MSQDTHQQNSYRSHTITIPEMSQVLQLRAEQNLQNQPPVLSNRTKADRPRVKWDESVIDNEHMNKKKTKICCIFHPQEHFEDDTKENRHCSPDIPSSSSSSSASSDLENEDKMSSYERRKARIERRRRKLKEERSYSPNAYEIQPDYTQYRDKHLHCTQ